MEKLNLEHLDLAELVSMEEEIRVAIAHKREMERSEVQKQVEAFVERAGFSIEDLFNKSWMRIKLPGLDKRRFVVPKYINPENTTETWTGRGRKPKWVENILKRGLTMEDIHVSRLCDQGRDSSA